MNLEISSLDAMLEFGEKLGRQLRGGEVIELIGDIGAGKTSLTKGITKGLEINDDVQSPSFTISRVYEARDDLRLAHYDFYRLGEPGIMRDELADVIRDPTAIVIIEWAETARAVLPDNRLRIQITSPSETTRHLRLETSDAQLAAVVEAVC